MPYKSAAARGSHVKREGIEIADSAPERLVVAKTVVNVMLSVEFLQLSLVTSATSEGSANVISTH